MPRTVNLITGPSRSADIEQTLILGAHGPRRLHVIVVGDAAADVRGCGGGRA
jgi:L-lactate dehydrogenase complex protein LldG